MNTNVGANRPSLNCRRHIHTSCLGTGCSLEALSAEVGAVGYLLGSPYVDQIQPIKNDGLQGYKPRPVIVMSYRGDSEFPA